MKWWIVGGIVLALLGLAGVVFGAYMYIVTENPVNLFTLGFSFVNCLLGGYIAGTAWAAVRY